MSIAITLTRDIAACLTLRRTVFIDEQGVSEADEIDELDVESLHLIAKNGSVPVGTARLYVSGDIAKIGRVCVLASHRGTGLGAGLIRAAVEQARQNSEAQKIKLGAQVYALGFYEKLGFTPTGPVYDDAGIGHRDMVMTL